MPDFRTVLILLLVLTVTGYVLYRGLAGVMRGVAEMERNADKTYQVVKDNPRDRGR